MIKNSKSNEEWIPIPFIMGECSLSEIMYDATDLIVKLDSFHDERTIRIVFSDIFAYRVTLEHFRWADFCHSPMVQAPLVKVVNSHHIEWIQNAGMNQLYDTGIDLSHYMLQTTEHIIDTILLSNSTISIDGKTI